MADNEGTNQITRRKFLGNLIKVIGGVVSAAVAVPLIGYFLSPAWKQKTPLLSPIARVDDIPVGEPTFVTYEERVQDGWYVTTLSKGAWVVNKGNGEVIVYDPRCTHLNCPFYWDKPNNRFHCPCHDGRFDIDGNVLGGPPPRPLDRLTVVIQEGEILVTGTV